nr:unnamed protein product [Callosobruchus chinensis]
MSGSSITNELEIVKHTGTDCTGSVIFLHEAGDSGKALLNSIKNLIGDFSYPHIEFYFPTAECIPYTPLEGELSRVWFDQWNTTPDVPEMDENMEEITLQLESLIDMIQNSLPRVSSPWYKTIIALHTVYRCLPHTAGVFALSSYLNYDSKVYEDGCTLEGAPLYMCHGNKDEVVPIDWGKKTFDSLKDMGVAGEFITMDNIGHELGKTEIQGLFSWIESILKPLPDEDVSDDEEIRAHKAMSHRHLCL